MSMQFLKIKTADLHFHLGDSNHLGESVENGFPNKFLEACLE